jgi:ubiquinone biosynthesis protein Coq4
MPVTDSSSQATSTNEADAIRIALTGRRIDRLRIATRALGRLLRDPEDTSQVFLLYVALNAQALPAVLSLFLDQPHGPDLMRARPAIDSSSVDFARLASLPPSSLGAAFARHMHDNGLSPDVFQRPPGAPPDIAFLAQRLRQSHDLWHVVTGYSTNVVDELALQAFTYAQIRAPGPLVLSVAGALRWGATNPRVLARVLEGYRRGKKARPMLALPWESLWKEDLDTLRRHLRIEPAQAVA